MGCYFVPCLTSEYSQKTQKGFPKSTAASESQGQRESWCGFGRGNPRCSFHDSRFPVWRRGGTAGEKRPAPAPLLSAHPRGPVPLARRVRGREHTALFFTSLAGVFFPATDVHFAEVLVADALTSLSRVFADVAVTFLLVAKGYGVGMPGWVLFLVPCTFASCPYW